MAKKPAAKKAAQRSERPKRGGNQVDHNAQAAHEQQHYMRPHEHRTGALKALNKAQGDYIQLLQSKDVIVGDGPAGTGKSFVATKFMAQQLEDRRAATLIFTRPAQSAEEELGFLPGEIDEKIAPYFGPLRSILESHFGVGAVECMIKNGRIVVAPMAFLRGHTFDDCIVLLDEAQNTTVGQMQLFLSRMGKNCTMIVDGDVEQTDIKVKNGLEDILELFGENPPASWGIQRFTEDDIVRSENCKEIIIRYRRRAQAERLAAAA